MSIRWKLLILLLLVALIPIALVTAWAAQATARLGEEIGTETRAGLTAAADQQLRAYIRDRAQIVNRASEFIELALQTQADAVERALVQTTPEDRRIYFNEDFKSPDTAPADLAPSDAFIRVDDAGHRVKIAISRSTPVTVIAPGADRAALALDIQRLASVTDTYRRIAQCDRAGDILFWQYTGLEDGVFNMYPGHGQYPDDYDHRTRFWYRQAKKRNAYAWSLPYIDEPSGRTVLTATIPVHRPDGAFAGVTAIDVTVGDLMGAAKPADYPSATVRLVSLLPREQFDRYSPPAINATEYDAEHLGLFIYGSSETAQRRGAGDTPFEQMWLDSPDHDGFIAMIRDMQAGESGIRHLDYKGRPHLWAYGRIARAYLVALVPDEEVTAQAASAEQRVRDLTHRQTLITAGISGGMILIVLLVAVFGSRAVTTPVSRLAEAAQRVAEGNFDTPVAHESRDELGQLARSFNDMLPRLRDQVRMRASLAVAMEVQQSLLPSETPTIAGLDICGHSTYCDETGGDYYDFLDVAGLSDTAISIAVGDVMGHGIAAAMMMANARGILRSRVQVPGTLGELLTHLNGLMVGDTGGKRFMTMLLMTIERKQGVLRLASAGHDPPWAYDPAGDAFVKHKFGGIPLGIAEGQIYEELAVRDVRSGMVYIAATDGVWEAKGPGGEMFGRQRLEEVIRGHAADSAKDIAEAIRRAVAEFQGESEPDDDITFVVVKVC